MSPPYFQPSLHVPPTGKYVVVAAAVANVPAAWMYAWATAPSPSLLDPLYTIGFGLWLALVGSGAARLGKIRHPQWMWRAGAALGALAWYVEWAAWLAMSSQPEAALQGGASTAGAAVYLCLRPDLMVAAAAGRVTNASTMLTGVAMVVVWLVELCACILPPALAGARRASAPFCEETTSWAKEVHVPLQFSFIDDPETVRRRLERNPRELYELLVPCSDEEPKFADVTIHRCCGNESFITIANFATMEPEQVPIPEIRNLHAAMPDKVQCYGQIDEPIVELLRFPVQDVDALIQRWENEAASASGCSGIGSPA